ncbi:hypothetical protein NG798_17440 [Ancylothrix sp. C2]|uniref:hypothetical protein n=1 Tax=Ancylothrix sp. D3o TaxID=2953691 RepID=UPI0021BADD6A|nr:hypothetical protein [Ancylothrix sp. D3o]MCT7951591.1 hypothetical protein [Ancylothrix sp. D3o]
MAQEITKTHIYKKDPKKSKAQKKFCQQTLKNPHTKACTVWPKSCIVMPKFNRTQAAIDPQIDIKLKIEQLTKTSAIVL